METRPSPTPVPGRPRRPWRRGGITLLAGGLVLAGAGAATAFLTRAQPDDPQVVRCFSIASPPFTGGAPGSYDASYGPGDGTLGQSASVAERGQAARGLNRGGRVPRPPA